MSEVKETQPKKQADEKYTEVGKLPVYKRAENLLAFSQFVGDLKDEKGKTVGDICNEMNGDIIMKVNGKGTYTVNTSYLIEFVNNLKSIETLFIFIYQIKII